MNWTVESINRLRELWSKGISCRVIAAMLGGCNRNMIIGKAFRMGLEKRGPTRVELSNRIRTKRIRIRKPREQRSREVLAILKYDMHIVDWRVHCRHMKFGSRPCTLMELEHDRCRWPLWTDERPERLYCGAATDGVYCCAHTRIAWRSGTAWRGRQ